MNPDEKRRAEAVLGRADAKTLVHNKLAETCPDEAVQRGGDVMPENTSVTRAGVCDWHGDLAKSLEHVTTQVDDMRDDVRDIKKTQNKIFDELKSLGSASATAEKNVALLAQRVKAEGEIIAQDKVDAASRRNLLLGGLISIIVAVIVAWLSGKIK